MKRLLLTLLGMLLVFGNAPAAAFDWDIFANPSARFKNCLLGHLDEKALDVLSGGRPDKRRLRKKAKKALSACGNMGKSGGSVAGKLIPFIDVHAHLMGGDFQGAAEKAFYLMDKIKIKQMIVMPPPQTFNQNIGDTIENYFSIVKDSNGRLKALGGGGTLNPMIMRAFAEGSVSDQLLNKFVERAHEIIEMGAIGFGEMTAEHISKREGHPYVSAPPDHQLFMKLSDIAAKFNVPIDLHMEAVPREMEIPEKLKFRPNPDILKANIPGLSNLLAHNRGAKIIWCHLGWGNIGTRTPDLMRELLLNNNNLFMSIKLNKSGLREVLPMGMGGIIRDEWLALFKEFPDRFMIGSDVKPSARGIHKDSDRIPKMTSKFLGNLPAELAKKFATENAERIFKL